MDILDVAPQEYKVGNNLQANPVGLVGSHIEGRFLNIVARASVRKNLEHCFQQAKIDIADQLIAPLVTANAVLTESERRSGCALIDFGADTTTISVYKNNILRFLTVLPLGGNSITRDITTLQMEEEEAERLKKPTVTPSMKRTPNRKKQPANWMMTTVSSKWRILTISSKPVPRKSLPTYGTRYNYRATRTNCWQESS